MSVLQGRTRHLQLRHSQEGEQMRPGDHSPDLQTRLVRSTNVQKADTKAIQLLVPKAEKEGKEFQNENHRLGRSGSDRCRIGFLRSFSALTRSIYCCCSASFAWPSKSLQFELRPLAAVWHGPAA